jgi:GAF domain-containing protein/HAMP domain-containing protein
MIMLSNDVLQLVAWLLSLVVLVLTLYILLLNPRHTANRHVSGLLFLIAANLFAMGLMAGGGPAAWIGMPLDAATVPAIPPAIFITSIVLLKPKWLHGRWRWAFWLVYGLVFLPIILTVLDMTLNTSLWYTSAVAGDDVTGFVVLGEFTTGTLGLIIRIINIYIMGIAPAFFMLYVALLDKEAPKSTQRLAWLLLVVQVATILSQVLFRNLVGDAAATIVTSIFYVGGYWYAAFQQMISERRTQRGRLQSRLTILTLVVAIPLLVAAVGLVGLRASDIIEQKAVAELASVNRALSTNLNTWLSLNIQSLQQIILQPDIVSMDAERQKPNLEAMDQAHPQIYLVSTTDVFGINVARSDGAQPKDYSDRAWVLGAKEGELTSQVLVGRTSGEPALVISLPIRDESGEIVGVGMLASDLDDISDAIQTSAVGESGFAFVVDELGQVVAHSNPGHASALQVMDQEPTVLALREGKRGAIRYQDDTGQFWRAHLRRLENGWGVIVQQPESELMAPIANLQLLSLLSVGLGVILLVVFTGLTIRQAILPIGDLTETAAAIAGGDLGRVAPVESEDEIGDLARAFNTMTGQLRELIGNLEDQVQERTHTLAQRSAYLEATADVGRASASILDIDQLVVQIVELIRERFGLYYVGLFGVEQVADDPGEHWAVLQAGTGEAGQAMLARGHRMRVGEGMVGWAIARGESRVAEEAGRDTMRLATPELPETRSEAALPLRSRGRVLGALTVQHTEPGAFDPETMAVLGTMASQVAVALDNARLFREGQEALEAAQQAYGELSQQAWRELLHSRTDWGYRFSRQGVTPVTGDWQPELVQAERSGHTFVSKPGQSGTNGHDDLSLVSDGLHNGTGGEQLSIPLKARDEVIGVIGFRKGHPGETWTPAEIELLETFVTQLEQALESARLYQDTQRHAAEEQLLGEVTARMRETLSLDTVLRTAIHEMGSALGLPKVEVRMVSKPPGPNNGNGLKRKHSDGPGPGATNGRSSKETTDAG